MIYVHCISQKKLYKGVLNDVDKVRCDRRIPREGVQSYKRCPFEYFFQSKNDQSLLNATGHDHTSFAKLLALFNPYYNYYTIDTDTHEICREIFYAKGENVIRKHAVPLVWYLCGTIPRAAVQGH